MEARRTTRDSRGREKTAWATIEREQSHTAFWLEDPSGRCLVHPAGAEITVEHRSIWYGDSMRPGPRTTGKDAVVLGKMFGNHRYTEELLTSQDTLCVLGWFETFRLDQRLEQEVNARLRDLKTDRRTLLGRFDRNKDGEVSIEEWDEARAAVLEDVLRARAALPPTEAVNTLTIPADPSLPFIVSGVSQTLLAGRYRTQSIFGIAAFFLGGIFAVWVFNSARLG